MVYFLLYLLEHLLVVILIWVIVFSSLVSYTQVLYILMNTITSEEFLIYMHSNGFQMVMYYDFYFSWKHSL